MMKRFFILISFLSASSFAFGQVPNTFQTGEVIKADTMNANFSYAGKRLKVVHNGTVLGDLLSHGGFSTSLLTAKGYVVSYAAVQAMYGSSATVGRAYVNWAQPYFTTTDCTGTPYHIAIHPKEVVRVGSSLYYIAPGATQSRLAVKSYIQGIYVSPTCGSLGSPQTHHVLPLTPNDPAVTGVSDLYLTGGTTLEWR